MKTCAKWSGFNGVITEKKGIQPIWSGYMGTHEWDSSISMFGCDPPVFFSSSCCEQQVAGLVTRLLTLDPCV
jgi:hypothetical protein